MPCAVLWATLFWQPQCAYYLFNDMPSGDIKTIVCIYVLWLISSII